MTATLLSCFPPFPVLAPGRTLANPAAHAADHVIGQHGHESALGQDARAGRTRVRTHRPFRKDRLLRCTGRARASVVIGLINFAHNLRRLATTNGSPQGTMHRQALAQASG